MQSSSTRLFNLKSITTNKSFYLPTKSTTTPTTTATTLKTSDNTENLSKSPDLYNYLNPNEFTNLELNRYGTLLNIILLIGLICHLTVLIILIYQQIRLHLCNKHETSNKPKLNNNINHSNNSRPTSLSLNQHNVLTIEENSKKTNNCSYRGYLVPSQHQQHQHQQHQPHKKQSESHNNNNPYPNLNKSKFSKYYVTFAFICHQILIDLIRIFYCLFYANGLLIDSKRYFDIQKNSEKLINASQTILFLNGLYQKYCAQMALFYSVLTMVTIINILTILISETCRFYDLKLNSNDTSNYCCVLFGIMLIWISSLIIISSLMLVGVADSAAPTWRCNLGETESTTRALVINIVWFLLVTFVLLIAFTYSCSLYRELSSLDYKHHRLSIYAAHNKKLNKHKHNDPRFFNHHIQIVNETSKRLIILNFLIIIFCFTFLPNFVMTLLKNIVDTNTISLRPFNLICSIINLSNPSLNSIVLLFLCLKSNETSLCENCLNRSSAYDRNDDEVDDDLDGAVTTATNKTIKSRIIFFVRRIFLLNNFRTTRLNDEELLDYDGGSIPLTQTDLSKSKTSQTLDEQDNWIPDCKSSECICLSNIGGGGSGGGGGDSNENTKSQQQGSSAVVSPVSYYSSLNNLQQFYSKVGNRLGNLN